MKDICRETLAAGQVAANPFSSETTIEAYALGKTFDSSSVLKDVTFSVSSGMSVAFMSPSGSGKSTLLSMLGLLLEPTAGVVRINGRDASSLPDKQRALFRQRHIGFVFQHAQLVGSLRATANVAMPASFAKGLSFNPTERAGALLEEFGLGERIFHYPHQLSIGQKRRIAVARALLLDPPIIIADEPTNDLDEESADVVTKALFRQAERGGILLYATHDSAMADRANKVLRLQGKTFVEV